MLAGIWFSASAAATIFTRTNHAEESKSISMATNDAKLFLRSTRYWNFNQRCSSGKSEFHENENEMFAICLNFDSGRKFIENKKFQKMADEIQ